MISGVAETENSIFQMENTLGDGLPFGEGVGEYILFRSGTGRGG